MLFLSCSNEKFSRANSIERNSVATFKINKNERKEHNLIAIYLPLNDFSPLISFFVYPLPSASPLYLLKFFINNNSISSVMFRIDL